MIRTLLVDDSPRFLAAARQALAGNPRLDVISEAHSGPEALTQIEWLHPDLVLLDLAMAGMNGFEATQAMKAREGAPRVILVSLYDEPLYRDVAAALGADGFVAKTEFATELPVVIERLFPHPAAVP